MALYGIVISSATIITMPLLSPFGDRYAKRSQIVFGLLALTIGALAVALAASLHYYSLPFLMAAGMLTVIAYAFIFPASINIAAELVSPTQPLCWSDKLIGFWRYRKISVYA